MSNIFNGSIKLNIFGESHSSLMGIGIDGLCPGIKIDFDNIKNSLDKRKPNPEFSNARIEDDNFECIAGLNKDGFTTGEELVFIIHNKNYDDSEYTPVARGSHADYTSFVRSNGYCNLAGGGARSGRLTALLVIAGAIATDILKSKGISLSSELISPSLGKIKDAFDNNYSLGGVVEAKALGVEAGLGEPFFDSIESVFSHLAFSIPGVKAIEFGKGTEFKLMTGDMAKDSIHVNDGKIEYLSNNNGGVIGGISNGMPIVARLTFKPTPSVVKSDTSVNLLTLKEEMTSEAIRHDACFALRCPIIVESILAITILEFYTRRYGYMWAL